MTVITIAAGILALGALIVFHELGHYLLARVTGMRVDRFSVGFGPVLLRKQVGETEFALSAVPLGGYVKIAGMDPTEPNEDPRGFNNKPSWARLLVIGAGPVANYILAAALFSLILILGPLVADTSKTEIGGTLPDAPAAEAGLQRGDIIRAVEGSELQDWEDLQEAIFARGGLETTLTVEREGETMEVVLVPVATEVEGRVIGQVGIMPSGKRAPGRPVGEALVGGVTYTWEWNARIVSALTDIVRGREKADLQGPVGIIRETNRAAEEGLVPLLILVAIISVHLALFNLLPLPALDGGRLVFLLLEAIRRKPVSAKIEMAVHAVGFVLLLGLIVVVTMKDIGRLFGPS